MIKFPGVPRKRHVEITTKSGNTVGGTMVREKDGLVQLKFKTEAGEEAIVTVDVESIDVIVAGLTAVDGDDNAESGE